MGSNVRHTDGKKEIGDVVCVCVKDNKLGKTQYQIGWYHDYRLAPHDTTKTDFLNNDVDVHVLHVAHTVVVSSEHH